jgi:hypothetical protein
MKATGRHVISRTTASTLAIALAITATLALFLGPLGAGCATTPLTGGIEGSVTIGPLQPVSRPGQADSKPYQAEIAVKEARSGRTVATFVTAADGTFRVGLKPGDYRLEPTPGKPLPVAPGQDVTVQADRFTTVTIQYDSGIR